MSMTFFVKISTTKNDEFNCWNNYAIQNPRVMIIPLVKNHIKRDSGPSIIRLKMAPTLVVNTKIGF